MEKDSPSKTALPARHVTIFLSCLHVAVHISGLVDLGAPSQFLLVGIFGAVVKSVLTPSGTGAGTDTGTALGVDVIIRIFLHVEVSRLLVFDVQENGRAGKGQALRVSLSKER